MAAGIPRAISHSRPDRLPDAIRSVIFLKPIARSFSRVTAANVDVPLRFDKSNYFPMLRGLFLPDDTRPRRLNVPRISPPVLLSTSAVPRENVLNSRDLFSAPRSNRLSPSDL